MSRLTLRLPESLHRELSLQADKEGSSLNQFIVYLLSRITTARDLEGQRKAFETLRSRYPVDESESALRDMLAARIARS